MRRVLNMRWLKEDIQDYEDMIIDCYQDVAEDDEDLWVIEEEIEGYRDILELCEDQLESMEVFGYWDDGRALGGLADKWLGDYYYYIKEDESHYSVVYGGIWENNKLNKKDNRVLFTGEYNECLSYLGKRV